MDVLELKAAIARSGKTIPKLAEEIGIGKKALYSKIKGESQFTQKEICKIAKALSLSDSGLLAIFFAEKVS